ncbi:PREDICTED: DENN domain-containing protein 1C isoform X1 [Dipodomys ordii]|uniref:DENN domain-containing protein 1C isoform X1 n=1 Tax=Dipodomys ordii TaxID=10020 RepID=A0A1S3FQK3_DIPOR|nr:PREDICTED: DENN domain-containing protein 1C isoform X1 [Dipodomys ordii]
MGSRAETDPPTVFDWFFEAACPVSLQDDPPILRQFPPDFRDQDAMRIVPKFCFPFDVEREPPSAAVQHFTFALTDLGGNRRFGFCRLRAGARSCLCILSHLPWFEVFYKILNTVGDLLAQDQVPEAEELLLNLLQRPPSGPRDSVGLELLSCFVAPDSDCLPSIPENRNLTELVVAMTDENILGLFAALLAERRVLLTASKLSTLTSCVHASCALLYPMRWEHVLIPTLPPHLLDYCCAPMPYLIGVHASLVERVLDKALEDVVVMNVDSNTLQTPFDDVQALPPDVVSLLRLRLRKVALSPGEGVSRLFLKAQALLFGGYRDALVCSPGQPVTFNEEAFLAQKPGAPLQAFHRRAVHLQLFKQFIEARLEKLNTGQGFSDAFEQEITCCGASSGTLRSYQIWADNLKVINAPFTTRFYSFMEKGGGALLHSVRSKTQPAVRNMYRSAKSGLKGVQSLLMYKDGDSGLQRVGSLRVPHHPNHLRQKRPPVTQHFRQSLPGHPSGFQMAEEPSGPLGDRISPLGLEDPQETLDSSFLGSGEELDLLSEIFDSLSVETKTAGGLRPSQSLHCWHRGNSDSCFSLPNLPGRWPPEEEGPPEPQPLSLPGDPPSLPNTPTSEGTCSQVLSPLQPSTTSADLECSPPLSEGPRAPGHLHPWHSTAPTQPNLPESPGFLAPTKPNSGTICRSQSVDSSALSFLEDSRTLPLQCSLRPKDPGAPTFPACPTNKKQEPQARRQTRIADLKKHFES